MYKVNEMKILLDEMIAELGPGIWRAFLPPHQVSMFGTPRDRRGRRSVILAHAPMFDRSARTLSFDGKGVTVLNLGQTPIALIVDPGHSGLDDSTSETTALDPQKHLGPGDQQFLLLIAKELREESRQAGEAFLSRVRDKHPGDLKEHPRLKFTERFWFVVIQPRAQALSISVRGSSEHLSSSKLQLTTDKSGYTRFKLQRLADVDEAIRLIDHSNRTSVQ